MWELEVKKKQYLPKSTLSFEYSFVAPDTDIHDPVVSIATNKLS